MGIRLQILGPLGAWEPDLPSALKSRPKGLVGGGRRGSRACKALQTLTSFCVCLGAQGVLMSKRETETEREGPGYRRGRAASLLRSYIIQTEANSKAGSTAAYANLRLRSLSQRSSMSRRIMPALTKQPPSREPASGHGGGGGTPLSAGTAEDLHPPSPLTLGTGSPVCAMVEQWWGPCATA